MLSSSAKSKAKLYHLSDATFSLSFYVDEKRIPRTTAAHDIPMLTWPSGAWCLPANVYMLELYHRGLSRKNRGGTLLAYAANISHLIRFCFKNKIDFIDLTDSEFSFFIKTLTGERSQNNPERLARDANSVIAIGRNCLDFLACVGKLYSDESFIGPTGQIVIHKRDATIHLIGRPKGRDKLIRSYSHHHSFPTPDPKKRRLPISAANITKLYDAVESASKTMYQRKRRYVMLKLLEITGGRRSEVAALTTESVRQAALMAEPKLKLLTAKRPKESYRYIPVARHDIEFFMEFIDINRRRVVRTTCGLEKDDGFVLVSETTGHKLRPNTITQEIRLLAQHATIDVKTCPHMFRHAFITNVFVALIERHHFENPDGFRMAILDTEAIKQEVLEWTGQSDIRSLDPYIHMAFAKIANFEKTLNSVKLGLLVDSLRTTIRLIRREMETGMSPDDALRQLRVLTESVESDLTRLGDCAMA